MEFQGDLEASIVGGGVVTAEGQLMFTGPDQARATRLSRSPRLDTRLLICCSRDGIRCGDHRRQYVSLAVL